MSRPSRQFSGHHGRHRHQVTIVPTTVVAHVLFCSVTNKIIDQRRGKGQKVYLSQSKRGLQLYVCSFIHIFLTPM